MIDRSSTEDRDPVEALAEEFVEMHRRGESPTIEEYVRRYPKWSEEIRELFPAIVAMEDLRSKKERRGSDGKVTLGPDRIQQLGDYRIIREIGRGGMGIVYEAEQQSLARRVAVKILPRQMLLDHNQLERFKREAQTAAKLHHTNIVPVFGVGEDDGFHYYVMQLICGVGLDAVLTTTCTESEARSRDTVATHAEEHREDTSIDHATKPPPLPNQPVDAAEHSLALSLDPKAIARIGVQVARALAHAHEQGTLHRDIKPSNLILDEDDHVWVADFGLAKALEHDPGSRTDHVVGTLRYMAPEQIQGKASPQSDVYSLGITLYELIAQRPAFGTGSTAELLDRIHHGKLESLRTYAPRLPRNLETIVLKAAAINPQHRYASASDLADDLDRFLNDQPIRARRVSSAERMWRWSKRNPALAAMTWISLTLLVVVAVVSTNAYFRERIERNKAEVSSRLASATLDSVFERFSPLASGLDTSEMIDATRTEPVLSREAAELLQDLLPFYERLAAQDADRPDLLEKAARSQLRVGEIHERLGEYDAAVDAYQKAIMQFERLSKGSDDFVRERARIRNQLGTVYSLTSREDLANEEHQRAIELLNRVSENPSPEIRFELARTYFLMARHIRPGTGPASLPLLRRAKRRERAIPVVDTKMLQHAIDILLDLRETEPQNPACRQLLANCYREAASDDIPSRVPLDDVQEQQAIEILSELVQEYPKVSDYRHDLIRALAEAKPVTPAWSEEQIAYHSKNLELATQHGETLMAERPDVALYSSTLTHVYLQLAICSEMSARWATTENEVDHFDKAESNFRKAIHRTAFLVKRYPDANAYRVWLGKIQLDMARLMLGRRRVEESHVFVTRAIRNLEKLPDEIDAEVVVTELRREAFKHLHATLIEKGDRELANLLRLGEDIEPPPGEMGPPRGPGRGEFRFDGPPPPRFLAPPRNRRNHR